MVVVTLITFALLSAACVVGEDPGDGNQIPTAYYERHKKHLPSPQDLADKYRHKQRAKEKAKVAHKKYLHSAEHHNKLMHEGNEVYQHARLHDPDDPETAHCGSLISARALGLKQTPHVQSIFRPMFLQSGGGPSMAQPGSGTAQVLKDEGRSEIGKVFTAEDGKESEPFVRVYKDGYSFAMCAGDAMYDFGDKFGFNKDQFKGANNVSIVRYEDLVLKELQKSMSPKVCFEFCLTVPDMVYFGIRGGRNCYCMPYYDKSEAATGLCDMPCPGQPTQMCGGKTKSQIFEMHLCADKAGDLLFTAVDAEVELVYFYDTAFMTRKFAEHLESIGNELKNVAGGGGDPGASDLAQHAIESAASLNDPNTGWGVCKADYGRLLDEYEASEIMHKEGDFTWAEELQKAEDSMAIMDQLRKKLHKCAKESEGPILEVYPFFPEIMKALDEKELQVSLDKYGDEISGFVPILYKIRPDDNPEFTVMSSCTGSGMGRPMPLKLPGCAMACELMHDPRCVGFQYFQMMDGDEQKPLCFLFHEIETIRTYRCDMLKDKVLFQKEASSRQITMSVGGFSSRGLRGTTKAISNSTKDHPVCSEVAKLRKYSGLSCQSVWGKESKWLDLCPEECSNTMGAKHTALCMYRNSLNPPLNYERKDFRMPFGSGNEPLDQANADFRIVEFGTDASGGAGPKIEGDIKMGNFVVKEPYGYVWTPGPAGQR